MRNLPCLNTKYKKVTQLARYMDGRGKVQSGACIISAHDEYSIVRTGLECHHLFSSYICRSKRRVYGTKGLVSENKDARLALHIRLASSHQAAAD